MATPLSQLPLRMKGQTTCLEHKGRQLDLYCKECYSLICHKCLSTSHTRHYICELSDITPEKRQDIQKFIDQKEKYDLPQLKNYIKSTDKLLKDNNTSFETLSHKLKMQTEKLKNDLDMLTAKTLSIYQKLEEDNIKLIKTYKKELELHDRQLTQQVEECKAALQQGTHIEIYDTGREIHYQISLPVKPVLGTASFTANTNPQSQLELALGKVDDLDQGQAPGPKGRKAVTKYKLLSQTKVLKEWNSPDGMRSICPTSDGQVWTSGYSNTLTLLDRNGKLIQGVKHSTVITDISLSPTADTLWVCDDKNNILEMVSGKLTPRFSTKEEPKCICVTASNHVIVGMAKHISKFTTQGQMVQTTSVTGTGKPLVCTPYRISVCPITHNVAVVDENDKDDGGDGTSHVIVMDTDLKELFVYRGDIPSTYKQSSHERAGSFDPWGVVYDSVGNIIIGNWDNKRVLLISGHGEFLRIIHKGTGSCTWAVGVDREDVLWAVFGSNVKLLQHIGVTIHGP